ncbi:hypothetical protein RhiJN_11325 [Ceratobasidium sp. AG-Ba]|nr:hypothetical protein RhiJN_11325 [Ceratobasidium sp. AG-Ba]
MLFKNLAISSLALLPLSASALSLARPEMLILDDQYSASVYAGWSYANCGLPTDPLQIKSIQVSPDPPQPGKDLTVTVAGKVQETIKEGAYADVVVKLGLIKLLKKTFDLCEEARSANVSVQCPVNPGDYTITHTVTLPKEIPQAKFSVDVRGYTVEEDDLLCLHLNADFMPDFPRLN